jgi:ferredoxin
MLTNSAITIPRHRPLLIITDNPFALNKIIYLPPAKRNLNPKDMSGNETIGGKWMVAIVNVDDCVACGVCADSCPQEAINADDIAVINEELCIDCGACIDECPNSAISLE